MPLLLSKGRLIRDLHFENVNSLLIVLDFHCSNDSDHKNRGAIDYKVTAGSKIKEAHEVMSFTSAHATCSGFNALICSNKSRDCVWQAGIELVEFCIPF